MPFFGIKRKGSNDKNVKFAGKADQGVVESTGLVSLHGSMNGALDRERGTTPMASNHLNNHKVLDNSIMKESPAISSVTTVKDWVTRRPQDLTIEIGPQVEGGSASLRTQNSSDGYRSSKESILSPSTPGTSFAPSFKSEWLQKKSPRRIAPGFAKRVSQLPPPSPPETSETRIKLTLTHDRGGSRPTFRITSTPPLAPKSRARTKKEKVKEI